MDIGDRGRCLWLCFTKRLTPYQGPRRRPRSLRRESRAGLMRRFNTARDCWSDSISVVPIRVSDLYHLMHRKKPLSAETRHQ
jgi:hypothetical protein